MTTTKRLVKKTSSKIVLTTKKGSATFPTNVKQPVAQEKLWWQYWK